MRASRERAVVATGSRGIHAALLVVAVAALVVLPPLFARLPPILDLPQQLAQIRLLVDAWGDAESPYRVAWAAPNRIAYPVLAAALAIGGAEWSPRLAAIGCGAVLAAALLLLGRRLGRPPEQAALAALFVYSGVYYGGFLSFLVGGAAFALWLALLADERPLPLRRRWLATAGAALLLYWAHVLWLAAAALIAVAVGPRRAAGARDRLAAVAPLLPLLAAAALWYAGEPSERSSDVLRYEDSPLDRLTHVGDWGRLVVCGLRGPWELALVLVLGLWAALALVRPAAGGSPPADPWLGRIALWLLALGVLLPDALGLTVLLAHRWLPWAAIVALLALPAPRLPAAARTAFAAALLLAHATMTAAAWRAHDRHDLRGFAASLEAVPDGARLLGLDFERVSPRFWIGPYFHMAAYAQLDREVELGYSFASTPTALVLYRQPRATPWTPGLEHQPRRLAPGDLDHFDYLLVHARPEIQARLDALSPRLEVVAGEPPWQLLAVRAR